MGDDDNSPCRSMLSNMAVRADRGDVDLMTESGGDPEMKATRLNSSVARRLDCECARAFRQALEVVMDGWVAEARKSLGRRLLELRTDESLRCMQCESGDSEAISVMV
jgi:hypothetical protein